MGLRIFIDDLEVGRVETVEVDLARDRLRLGGLDGPATMFFSALVGPGDPTVRISGRMTIRDQSGRIFLAVTEADVLEHSTGAHGVVLAATNLLH